MKGRDVEVERQGKMDMERETQSGREIKRDRFLEAVDKEGACAMVAGVGGGEGQGYFFWPGSWWKERPHKP